MNEYGTSERRESAPVDPTVGGLGYELSVQAKVIDELYSELMDFRDALTPVLLPEGPSPAEADGGVKETSQMADRAASNTDMVRHLTVMVRELRKRVHL